MSDSGPIVGVANLDIDAATAIIQQLRFIKTGDEWDDRIYDITKEAVHAALGITEVSEGRWCITHNKYRGHDGANQGCRITTEDE